MNTSLNQISTKINGNTPSSLIIYNPQTGFADGMNFQQSENVIDALEKVKNEKILNNGIAGSKNVIDRFIKNLRTINTTSLPKVIKLINSGSSAIVFETENGDILKITDGNHFPLNRPCTSFDIPIFQRGKAKSTYYYIEEKAYQHGMTDGFVKIIKKMIQDAGFKPNDLQKNDLHQIGITQNGKLYLLDPECAKYKTIFHALFDKFKNLLKRL